MNSCYCPDCREKYHQQRLARDRQAQRPRPRRKRKGPAPTLGRFVALLFVVGLIFHYPWLLLLVAPLLGVWAAVWWDRNVRDAADPSRIKPTRGVLAAPREPTVQVLVAGMTVVSTLPARYTYPRMVGHISHPTPEEQRARDFEYGHNLVLVDWYGGRRQWESLDHLELYRELPWPPSPGTGGGRRP